MSQKPTGTIHKLQPENLNAVMDIWLSSNIEAHSFIPASYWQKQAPGVRGALPEAEVYVYEMPKEQQRQKELKHGCGTQPAGFAGLQEDYLAGIFIRKDARSGGIGKALLDFCKEKHEKLTLHVYEKNKAAIRFYLKNGFKKIEESVDEMTGEKEYRMEWNRTAG